MNLTFRIWRQDGPETVGHFETYEALELEREQSLLEALDQVNERLVRNGKRPVAIDSDCREGICGACGVVVDGFPHGPRRHTTTCELTLKEFSDGATITLEPFQNGVFRVVRDLVVDRSALDRIVQSGGYVSVRAGSAPDANTLPVAKATAESALDAAACIGCGACVVACPNGSASLFVAAKVTHLALLPQGRPERARRALSLAATADAEGFGACSGHRECEAACPKGIPVRLIARLNREVLTTQG